MCAEFARMWSTSEQTNEPLTSAIRVSYMDKSEFFWCDSSMAYRLGRIWEWKGWLTLNTWRLGDDKKGRQTTHLRRFAHPELCTALDPEGSGETIAVWRGMLGQPAFPNCLGDVRHPASTPMSVAHLFSSHPACFATQRPPPTVPR